MKHTSLDTSVLGLVVMLTALAWISTTARGQDSLLAPPQRRPWQAPIAAPDDHDAHWLTAHGSVAQAGPDAACASCHTENQCASCHAGLVEPPSVHPPGFLLLHGTGSFATQDCASCHTVSRFCAGCHIAAEVSPNLDARPPVGFTIHPDGWLNPDAPYNHADEARLDLMQCASCHAADSCTTCHATINPHGDDFSDRCRPMWDAGAPTCVDCHTPDSRVPASAIPSHPACQ